MPYKETFPGMKPGDVFATLNDSELREGKSPLCKELYLKTDDGYKDLDGTSLLYAKELRLGVCLPRMNNNRVFEPLEQRAGELAEYRRAAYLFRKNPDPNDNFYRVTGPGTGTIWINNSGRRSLRFQTSDGLLYRVCAGNVQPLTALNSLARIDPYLVVLDVSSGDRAVDVRIQAVHVWDGGTWRRGNVYLHCGDETDSYHLRVQYKDDCLGIFESYSSYFMGRPALHVLDTDSYGPTQWYVRNAGDTPLTLSRSKFAAADVPADQAVYALKDMLVKTDLDKEALL